MGRGILPKATLEKKMLELGIWTKEDEEKLTDLQRQLVDFQIELEASTTHEAGLSIAKEMGVLRADCLTLVEAKASVLSNSCESLSDGIRRDAYIAYATVYSDTAKKVFRDYHDFLLRASEPAVRDARAQVLDIATRTFQEALTSLPEVGYVRNVEDKIRKEAAEVEAKEAKKSKKKTTNKKKATSKKKTVKRKVTK
jgi:hypothetical protein